MDVEIHTEVLISEAQTRSVLWDSGNDDCKNRDLKNKTWEEIYKNIIPTFEDRDDNLKKKSYVSHGRLAR